MSVQLFSLPIYKCLIHFKMCLIYCFALAHFLQYLVSVPLKMFRLWAFMGMMAQVRHIELSRMTFLLNTSSPSQTNTQQPLSFNLCRFLWLGLWVDSWLETMATPPCGSHSSLASLWLCWCMSTTTILTITGPLHSPGWTHTPACRTSQRVIEENVKVTIKESAGKLSWYFNLRT